MDDAFDEPTGYAIIAAMAPHPLPRVGAETRLRDDLMFDSIRLIELAMALERQFRLPSLDLSESTDLTTAGDVLNLVRRQLNTGGRA
ncbi:phosphopantetheine-binding protein [Micromonospora sp. WMMA1363]|uniref:acyl carrier protein n=1 Tax=Micromonospora sp. WMMA1363 TaxID=3053985 RepID=UPI00259CB73F|nr:phosphopantetheine-binding protein [Micromonospora sp. WMMA1363]MDM4722001.1 phosphopantetheine-binding protein [Micromonospora sp. WMMA1363]